VWLALYRGECDKGLVNQIEGAYDDPIISARALGRIINECGADHAYLALCRHEGRPRESDRELWRELRGLVSTDRLIDMVVFGPDESCSMRTEDAAAVRLA
jgi:hypothetical protein